MSSYLLFGIPSHFELAIILFIGILVFGTKLPKMIRGTTKTIREFRKGLRDNGEEEKYKGH
jgi:TatA/E family protein of Tat protein translocase